MTAVWESNIVLHVNGCARQTRVEHRALLIDVLRNHFGLTGTKRACDAQVCGSCTVLMDDKPTSSCSTLAVDCDGRRIHTIEADDAVMRALQAAFVKHGALQCGFCTPGMIVAARALLARHPLPSREDIQHYLHGNICRCTGYQTIVAAVANAAQDLHQQTLPGAP